MLKKNQRKKNEKRTTILLKKTKRKGNSPAYRKIVTQSAHTYKLCYTRYNGHTNAFNLRAFFPETSPLENTDEGKKAICSGAHLDTRCITFFSLDFEKIHVCNVQCILLHAQHNE